MIFRRKNKSDDYDDDDFDDEEEEVESVLLQGAFNGEDANLAANARLVRAGLVAAKELITNGLDRRAGTIVLEPKGQRAMARFVIDGVTYSGARLPGKQGLAVTQMVKLLAGLDIQQRRKPQSGGIHAQLGDTKYDLSVESTPIAEGVERLTIRVRNLGQKIESAEEVGFSETMKAKIRELSTEKRGAVLVCGPPHSGTTTTTIAVVRSVDAYMYQIFNIADLGGRELMHVVDFDVDLEHTFEETLLRITRKESDVLLMDPIRTVDAARNVFEAATKMMTIAEFTAKDATHGIAQLTQWLGDPKIVAEGLAAIVSQKLVRRLCGDCKTAFRPNPKVLARVGLPPETRTLYRPPVQPSPAEMDDDDEEFLPCEKCDGVGYIGQIALFELLEIVGPLKELVQQGANVADMKAVARQERMQTLQKEGLRFVGQGDTSLEELQRAFKLA